MIIFSKLLGGRGTISRALRLSVKPADELESCFIRFSTESNPVVMWNCTNECNLHCKHCYLSSREKMPNELSTEEAKQMISEVAEMRPPIFGFTGGEPLVREDFEELVKHATDEGLRVIVSSNGTLISRKRALKLKELGVQYIGISLDGASASTHDSFREMPGSFDQALEGIKACSEADLKVGVRMALTGHNYHETSPLLDLTAKMGVPRFCVYYLVPSGRGRDLMDWDLTKEQRLELLDFLYRRSRELLDKVEVLTTCGPMDGVYILERLKEEQPEVCDDVKKLLGLAGGCSAGSKICGIGPEGTVHPCQFMVDKVVGSVRERSLKEIWSDPENEPLRVFRDKQALKGKCGACEYKDICGGCRIRAYHAAGDYLHEDPACFYEPAEMKVKS